MARPDASFALCCAFRRIRLLAGLVAVSASLVACGGRASSSAPVSGPPPVGQAVGLANPASVYCVRQKGQIEILSTLQGQIGMCHLPDGRVMEEWALWRSAHP